MTTLIILVSINIVGTAALLVKQFGVSVPREQTSPDDTNITLDSDTEGLV